MIWIFTASSISNEGQNKLKERGVSEVVTKPVDIKELLAKIDKLK